MKKIFIYLLIDPRRPEIIRYVGQTATPHSRLIQHCCESGRSAKCQWLELMAREGVMPSMVVIEETTELWIDRFSPPHLGHLSNTFGVRHVFQPALVDPVPESQPLPAPASTSPAQQKRTLKVLREVEIEIIHDTIKANGGDKEKAAKALNISLATLYRKLSAAEASEHFP